MFIWQPKASTQIRFDGAATGPSTSGSPVPVRLDLRAERLELRARLARDPLAVLRRLPALGLRPGAGRRDALLQRLERLLAEAGFEERPRRRRVGLDRSSRGVHRPVEIGGAAGTGPPRQLLAEDV